MAESGTEKELAKNDGISAENKFQAELFLNVFLPAADILKIADVRKENNRKVSVDDVMKNPRFEDLPPFTGGLVGYSGRKACGGSGVYSCSGQKPRVTRFGAECQR